MHYIQKLKRAVRVRWDYQLEVRQKSDLWEHISIVLDLCIRKSTIERMSLGL